MVFFSFGSSAHSMLQRLFCRADAVREFLPAMPVRCTTEKQSQDLVSGEADERTQLRLSLHCARLECSHGIPLRLRDLFVT